MEMGKKLLPVTGKPHPEKCLERKLNMLSESSAATKAGFEAKFLFGLRSTHLSAQWGFSESKKKEIFFSVLTEYNLINKNWDKTYVIFVECIACMKCVPKHACKALHSIVHVVLHVTHCRRSGGFGSVTDLDM